MLLTRNPGKGPPQGEAVCRSPKTGFKNLLVAGLVDPPALLRLAPADGQRP